MEPTDLVCLANDAIQETELAPASSGLDLTRVNASSLPVNTSDEIGLQLVGMHACRLARLYFYALWDWQERSIPDSICLFKFNWFGRREHFCIHKGFDRIRFELMSALSQAESIDHRLSNLEILSSIYSRPVNV